MAVYDGDRNKLPLQTRVQILAMLCEGSPMRSISRVAGVSINTVSKLLVDAGKACAAFHDKNVRNMRARRSRWTKSGRSRRQNKRTLAGFSRLWAQATHGPGRR